MSKSKKIVREPLDREKPDYEQGLSYSDVAIRIEKGYHNKTSKANEKSVGEIIFHNVFTFFNTILLIIAVTFIIFIVYLSLNGQIKIKYLLKKLKKYLLIHQK